MRNSQSLPLVAGLLIVGLCSVSSVLAQEGKGGASECQQARQAWLAANPLPATYEQLLEIDSAHRNLVLAAMAPELRSAMWRRHLNDYLEANRYRLNDLQIVQIQRGIDLFSPLFFTFRAETPGRAVIDQAIADFRTAASQVFTDAQFAEIFVKIGPAKGLGTGTGGHASRKPLCNCRYGFSDECSGAGEECQAVNCEFTIECGMGGDELCTGHCRL